MAEKDKYAEEMLTDEELDNVVGGNWFENYFDAVELYNRGLIENLTRVTTRPANLMDILHKMGYTGYKCDYNEVNIYVNKSGNSGMATGGAGDVLAGVIGALLAQKHLSLSPFDAATLGVYIHGLAGDRAAKALGEYSLMAKDIAENIRI